MQSLALTTFSIFFTRSRFFLPYVPVLDAHRLVHPRNGRALAKLDGHDGRVVTAILR